MAILFVNRRGGLKVAPLYLELRRFVRSWPASGWLA
jgi:hypothetical protein